MFILALFLVFVSCQTDPNSKFLYNRAMAHDAIGRVYEVCRYPDDTKAVADKYGACACTINITGTQYVVCPQASRSKTGNFPLFRQYDCIIAAEPRKKTDANNNYVAGIVGMMKLCSQTVNDYDRDPWFKSSEIETAAPGVTSGLEYPVGAERPAYGDNGGPTYVQVVAGSNKRDIEVEDQADPTVNNVFETTHITKKIITNTKSTCNSGNRKLFHDADATPSELAMAEMIDEVDDPNYEFTLQNLHNFWPGSKQTINTAALTQCDVYDFFSRICIFHQGLNPSQVSQIGNPSGSVHKLLGVMNRVAHLLAMRNQRNVTSFFEGSGFSTSTVKCNNVFNVAGTLDDIEDAFSNHCQTVGGGGSVTLSSLSSDLQYLLQNYASTSSLSSSNYY